MKYMLNQSLQQESEAAWSEKRERRSPVSTDPLVLKSRNPPRILLVDDDPTFGLIMKRLARYEGADMTVCHNMDELSMQMNSTFDVAVLDYALGAVTGIELSNYLERYFPDMPMVLVSQTRPSDISRKSDHVRGFVHKALGPYAIMDAVFEAHDIALIYRDMRRLPKKNLN